ncbi:XRE family transcriptional regulator [Roseibium denhamense]|uniref:Transcriptional regulator, contains XRE-family HTH domain n=1 Tax=Roseibium denhamense TaxID=76305 RepID=A0ABY1N6C7_9HYPH|nr:helix-turn-helix transcriptional regulator [Roseibium denhamense]MTI06123.1 XRE family transcriptional regulator [Roseibium denhamense]SMP01055.1 Transcriptional regulator, contains XRE-family HTH domain [Roseibium denhamense]
MNGQTRAFGESLRTLRKEQGFSQAELAARLGTTQRHVSFLETGRAAPSRFMLERIERELALPIARVQVLFENAGFVSPYKRRTEDSPDVIAALDLIDRYLLANWPFPAFVLDKHWNVLRQNTPGRALLDDLAGPHNRHANFFEIFLSPSFRKRVLNWRDAAPIFAARLYRAASHDEAMRSLLDQAQKAGLLDDLEVTGRDDIPVFVPVEIEGPDGQRLRLTSLLGQLASVQDAIVEGMTVEMMVPLDDGSQECLLAAAQSAFPLKAAE